MCPIAFCGEDIKTNKNVTFWTLLESLISALLMIKTYHFVSSQQLEGDSRPRDPLNNPFNIIP